MKISYNQIEEYCNELHRVATRMNVTLSNVKNLGESVSKSGTWTGEAADYFTNKMNTMSKDFEGIFRELENCILFLANSAEGYQSIDEKIMHEICNNLNITSPNLNTSDIFKEV